MFLGHMWPVAAILDSHIGTVASSQFLQTCLWSLPDCGFPAGRAVCAPRCCLPGALKVLGGIGPTQLLLQKDQQLCLTLCLALQIKNHKMIPFGTGKPLESLVSSPSLPSQENSPIELGNFAPAPPNNWSRSLISTMASVFLEHHSVHCVRLSLVFTLRQQEEGL